MKLFGRRRGGHRRLTDDEVGATWQVVSVLLEYPGDDFGERLAVVEPVIERLPASVREPLGDFVGFTRSRPLSQLQTDYVATFDLNRRCALYLTYFTHGDTRKRGMALLRFKEVYAEAGVRWGDEELPDHLCVLLEFGAVLNREAARELLEGHRVGIELLYRALADRERGSGGWSSLITALSATLTELDANHETALAKLIAQGPPNEEVGLDGYALDPALSAGRMDPGAPMHPPAAMNPTGPVDLGATIRVGAAR